MIAESSLLSRCNEIKYLAQGAKVTVVVQGVEKTGEMKTKATSALILVKIGVCKILQTEDILLVRKGLLGLMGLMGTRI